MKHMNVEEISMTSGIFSKCHLQGDSSLDGLFQFFQIIVIGSMEIETAIIDQFLAQGL